MVVLASFVLASVMLITVMKKRQEFLLGSASDGMYDELDIFDAPSFHDGTRVGQDAAHVPPRVVSVAGLPDSKTKTVLGVVGLVQNAVLVKSTVPCPWEDMDLQVVLSSVRRDRGFSRRLSDLVDDLETIRSHEGVVSVGDVLVSREVLARRTYDLAGEVRARKSADLEMLVNNRPEV